MRSLWTLIAGLSLFCTISTGAFGQRVYPLESNNWYFGNRAGIRFVPDQGGRPVAVTGATNLAADEGTTAISDTLGNLHFYVGTTGPAIALPSVVFNKQHLVMENGTDIIGGSSSTQNAIALRQPGSFSSYYIFSVAQVENYGTTRPKGFYYTRVDMAANNGLGRVDLAKKNVQIIDSITEKVSAVLHRNERDIWVLSHKYRSNRFLAVLLSDTGVAAPVFTDIGVRHNISRGALKLSPNGNRMACVLTEAQTGIHYIQVGSFNNLTGEVFDLFHIPLSGASGFGVYGVEFSPDNSKLYVGDRQRDRIYQFDLCAGDDSTSIINSKFDITAGFEPGTLQLGLDGSIYISKVGATTTLAAITAPNEIGAACQFVPSYVTLATGTSADRGLTNVNQSVFNRLAGTLEYTRLCERDTVLFTGQAQCQGVLAEYFWDFGDPASGALNSDTGKEVTHFYATPGTYPVRLVIEAGNQVDTIRERITITPLAQGFVIYDSLACKQTYRYSFEQDTTGGRSVAITNYRWKATGYIDGQNDTTYEGAGLTDIEITWDSNQVAQFALYLETQTSLGEVCISDSLPFRVKVNQRQGATPIGPDTICLDPELPFVITSPDTPRSHYEWVYTPSSDPAQIQGQGTDSVRVFPTTVGPKTIKTAFFLDTLNGICYTESAPKRFFAAAPPSDSILVFGDSSICESPTSLFRGLGRNPSSAIHWGFQSNTTGEGQATFQTDVIGDEVRVAFDRLALGRNKYFITAQEVSRDGCRGPVSLKEVWNACIEFTNFVSPNGDGKNEGFKIGNLENFPDNELAIYNRWGKRVFKGSNYQNDPSLMALAPGIYFYKARVLWEGRNLERAGWFEVAK